MKWINEETLAFMIESESEDYDYSFLSEAEKSVLLFPAVESFEMACLGALIDSIQFNEILLKEGVSVFELMEEDGPYSVYMTLLGSGVGIGDGRWDHFFVEPKDIQGLIRCLEEKLSYFADITGGGSLPGLFRLFRGSYEEEY